MIELILLVVAVISLFIWSIQDVRWIKAHRPRPRTDDDNDPSDGDGLAQDTDDGEASGRSSPASGRNTSTHSVRCPCDL